MFSYIQIRVQNTYVNMYAHVHVSCQQLHGMAYVYVSIFVLTYIHVYGCKDACIYIHKYIYTQNAHTYIYIYIYAYVDV